MSISTPPAKMGLMISLHLFLFLLAFSHVKAQTLGDVKFSGTGSSISTGRVELYWDNTWNTICIAVTDQHVGDVICKQLGFSPASSDYLKQNNAFLPVPGASIRQKNVKCDGSEASITTCAVVNADASLCPSDHSSDMLLLCKGSKPGVITTTKKPDMATLPPVTCDTANTVIKLEGGTSTEGRVMIKYNTQWGAICDDGWGLNDAKVVCNMLCQTSSQAMALIGQYTSGVNRIWLTNLQCNGSEKSITDCPHPGWGNHNCKMTEAAAVRCSAPTEAPPEYPQPTIKCSISSMVASFSIKNFPTVKPVNIRLLSPMAGCGFTSKWHDATETSIDVTVPLNNCGTVMKTNDTDVVYSNTLVQEVPDVGQVVSRIQEYRVPIGCVTPRTVTVPPKPIEPFVIEVPPVFGGLTLKFNLTFDKNGKSLVNGQVALGDDFNVQLDLETDDKNLKMVVTGCYAQAGQTAAVHQLITNKCPKDNTVVFQPINATSFSFNMKAFQFLNYPNEQIYYHCTAHVCAADSKTSQCDQTCGARRRKRDVTSRTAQPSTSRVVVSEGLTVTRPGGDDWLIVTQGEIIRYVKKSQQQTSTVPQRNPNTSAVTEQTNDFASETSKPSTPVPNPLEASADVQETTTNGKSGSAGMIKDNVIAVKVPGSEANNAASISILSLFSLVASVVAIAMTYVIR
ncbi:deleted in malignant brain tumors 1 protein-like [Lineus longissimus]|uniref:deleted in malignant brain tumors 1 protein-like n=1 Tax=Lineus longissimus TaxID=88925 RepID=UPI002B4DC862